MCRLDETCLHSGIAHHQRAKDYSATAVSLTRKPDTHCVRACDGETSDVSLILSSFSPLRSAFKAESPCFFKKVFDVETFSRGYLVAAMAVIWPLSVRLGKRGSRVGRLPLFH